VPDTPFSFFLPQHRQIAMLSTIRERAQGWIAWAIVILISIPFALWGIQSYLGVGAEPIAIKVNGIEITQRELDTRYQQVRMRLREQLGAAWRPELFDEKTMRQQVLDQMVEEALLLQVSRDMGLRASDAELRAAILANPTFQDAGRFSRSTYERMVELQGMSPPQYEEALRQRIVGTQLERAVIGSEVLTERELAEAVRLQGQEREVSYVRVAREDFESEEPIPEDMLRTYYQENPEQFRTAERVKLRYLVLDASIIGEAQGVDEETLRETYEADIDRFRAPERRTVRHILVQVPAAADAAVAEDAKERAAEIRQRILAGEGFADVAREVSEDPGSAPQGGELGTMEPGLMDPAFDQAAFALPEGRVSEPVRSAFGYHLIEVTDIEEAAVKPFAEVRDELAEEAGRRGAEALYFDWAERLANLTYEAPDSLEPAAEALGLEIQESGWLERSGGEGIFANPRVMAAAFSDEVLRQGLNSEIIEPEHNVLQAVVLRVGEHEEASVRPFDDVRDQIASTLREQRAAEAAAEAASAMVERLRGGASLAEAAGDRPVVEAGMIGREASAVPPAVRSLAFTLPRPGDGGASFGSASLAGGDAAVVAVSAVEDGSLKGLEDPAQERARREIAQTIGSAYFDGLVEDLKVRAKIERLGRTEAE
jgi:peptidyl-prolyl cis-trans isomerase D